MLEDGSLSIALFVVVCCCLLVWLLIVVCCCCWLLLCVVVCCVLLLLLLLLLLIVGCSLFLHAHDSFELHSRFGAISYRQRRWHLRVAVAFQFPLVFLTGRGRWATTRRGRLSSIEGLKCQV